MTKRSEGTAGEKKPRQQSLKGMEPVDIPELTAAAEDYESAMLERVKLTKKESEAQATLLEVLKKHKRIAYRTPDGLMVTLKPGTPKAKVSRADEGDERGEAGEDD
jgi:hypothetical protein